VGAVAIEEDSMSPRQMDQDEEPTSPLPDEEQQNQRHGSGSVFS